LAGVLSERYDARMSGDTALSVLRRLIDPAQGDLSPGAAEAVLQLGFDPADQTRIEALASKSNLGTLTSEEAEEYDGYIAAADLLSLWKSKARLSQKHHSTAA
jgi:hypothetical protein